MQPGASYQLLQCWAPLRAGASSATEMVSALLFGETCTIAEVQNDWCRVTADYDNYEGWIPAFYLFPVNEVSKVCSHNQCFYLSENGQNRISLSPGANILSETLEIEGQMFSLIEGAETESLKDAVQLASMFMETPYLWGGRSLWGIDCSGLIQVVFKMLNKPLPRDAKDQFLTGSEVAFEDRQPGDLAFFGKENHITHVGILSQKNEIIHAHGKVRKDRFDEQGIFNTPRNLYTHQLAGIKRV